MTTCKNIIFAFLLMCSLLGNAFAQTYPWSKIKTSINNRKTMIDSVKIYDELIARENANANYEANIFGVGLGGVVIGLGGLVFFLAATSEPSTDKSKNVLEHIGEDMRNTIGTFMLEILGVMIAGGGGTILAVNIVKYKRHKRHAKRRDEYQQALYRYQEKNSMRFIISPAVNLLSGGGGINAVLQF